jgi:hypothetical protein
MNGERVKERNIEKAIKMRWYALWPITAALILYPINSLPTRIGTLVLFAALWSGSLYFSRRRKPVVYALISITVLMILFFILPGRNPDSEQLRSKYIACLAKYEGTRYIWGGENCMGIDCSGLVRSGLIVADYKLGIATANPKLMREATSMWWHDCSAKALGEEYRHVTTFLFSSPSINQIDLSRILPGDIAVTADGIHTLAYLGDKTWIEADPDLKKVIKVRVPSDSTWFQQEVRILRWTELDAKKPGTT